MEKTTPHSIVIERVFGHFLGVRCSFYKPETNRTANALFLKSSILKIYVALNMYLNIHHLISTQKVSFKKYSSKGTEASDAINVYNLSSLALAASREL
jgi:hypothetical protein